MKSLLIIGLFFLLPFVAKSQTQQQHLDSLHLAVKTAANDTVKMLSLRRLAEYYANKNPDSALYYIEQYLPLTKKLKQPLWTAYALFTKSYLLPKPENQLLAFKLNNEFIAIAKETKNENNAFIPQGKGMTSSPHAMRLNLLALGYAMLAGAISKLEISLKQFNTVMKESGWERK